MHMTHIQHSGNFGSSGASQTQQQEISVKIASQCNCGEAKRLMSLLGSGPSSNFPKQHWESCTQKMSCGELTSSCCSDCRLRENVSPQSLLSCYGRVCPARADRAFPSMDAVSLKPVPGRKCSLARLSPTEGRTSQTGTGTLRCVAPPRCSHVGCSALAGLGAAVRAAQVGWGCVGGGGRRAGWAAAGGQDATAQRLAQASPEQGR